MRGDAYRAVRSKSGRVWAEEGPDHSSLVILRPLGDDVRPAQVGGKMQGGVRRIRVPEEQLCNPRRWIKVGSVCPECDEVAADMHAEVQHMTERHPEIIERRMVAAGFRREPGTWVDFLA